MSSVALPEPHLKRPKVEPLDHVMNLGGPAVGNIGSGPLLDKSRCCCSLRCLLLLFGVLFCLTVAAMIVVSVEISQIDEVDDFDEFFRTPEEQAKFEKEIFLLEQTLLPTGSTVSKYRCRFQCSKTAFASNSTRRPFLNERDENGRPSSPEGSGSIPSNSSERRKREVAETTFQTVLHACCVSKTVFIDPSEAFNIYNKRIIVVQREDKRQFFKSYNCSHVEDCTGCNCCQSVAHHRAVVRRPNKNKKFITTIVLPGCCKCYNNLQC